MSFQSVVNLTNETLPKSLKIQSDIEKYIKRRISFDPV